MNYLIKEGRPTKLEGDLILEIPVQKSGKIPQSILDYANENFIKIRDINGKIYNQNGS